MALGKGKKADVKKKEIPERREKAILSVAAEAAKRCKSEKERAEYIKLELDDRFGGPWNVVVGKKFGGVITYIPGHFMYFSLKDMNHLVYNTRNMKGPGHFKNT
ncbi:uncharacterized protein LOC143451682 [Clavelina lepadiformis]|uniref:uncharacterized protein LOC143451682 n=1 Tax=Clavelina lepadiformis TaxID=159417 RepID=UPI004043020F